MNENDYCDEMLLRIFTFVSILIAARLTGYWLSSIKGDNTVIHSSGLIDFERVKAASSAERVT